MRTKTFFQDTKEFRCRSNKYKAKNIKKYANTNFFYAQIFDTKDNFLFGHIYEANGLTSKGLAHYLDLFELKK